MSHPTETRPSAPSRTADHPAQPRPRPNGPQVARGELFRALVNAGADAVVAYTAERDTEAMIVEVAAAQSLPVLQEVQRLRRDMEARFDATDARFEARFDATDARFDATDARFEARFDAIDSRFDAIDARFDAVGKQIEAVGKQLEAMGAQLADAIQDGARRDRQLAALAAQTRLILAGFGVLVTVLIAVFGFLFTR